MNMKKAILGKKLGMTQIFSADGTMIPVTVVEAGPCTVVQKKTVERDGYCAIKVAYGETAERKLNKSELGQLKVAKAAPLKMFKEFRLENCDLYEVGNVIKCDVFAVGDKVDATATSKGHGFTGVIKRWNQSRLKMTHGTGPTHREVGSMGANSTPSRVFKGKHLAGQYGSEQVTIQNLEIVKVDQARGVLLIRGAVPGPKGAVVLIKNSVKSK